MGMNLMGRYGVAPDQRSNLAIGADLIDGAKPDDRVEVLVVHADGARNSIVLPKAAAEMIGALLRNASESDKVAILAETSEISPEDAASILGISRPLVHPGWMQASCRFAGSARIDGSG